MSNTSSKLAVEDSASTLCGKGKLRSQLSPPSPPSLAGPGVHPFYYCELVYIQYGSAVNESSENTKNETAHFSPRSVLFHF